MTGGPPANRPGCPVRPTDPDRLDPAGWRAWIDHLDGCDRCREAWLTEDPARCFAWLTDEPIPAAVLEEVSRGVRRSVDAEAASPARRARPVATTIAASVLAASLTAGVFLTRPPAPSGEPGLAWDAAAPASRARADVAIRDASGGVRVVDLTVGDRQVVMIFDERMQL